MADVTIKYKGANIATMDASGTKTLETSGKYCEGDVQVVYADPEKPTQSKTVTPTASGFTVSPDSGKVLSSVVVNGDADLIASNIRSGKNIFGVDGTLVEGITPSGNKAITATTSTQTGIDVTDYATVSVAPTPSETKSTTTNGDVTPSSGKLLSKVTVNVPTGTARSASDLTVSGATVTVPAGLYSAQATKSVASGSAGTPSASKGTVSNHSVTVTPSVTNTTGYITGGTKTGTGVTVSASELVSGNKALTPSTTAQTNIDVKNYATASVSAITKELLASLDSDFVAENIKKDVDLFGLLGTLEGGGGGLGQYTIGGTYTPVADEEFASSGIWQAMGVPASRYFPYQEKHTAISLPFCAQSRIENTVLSYYRPRTGNSCCFLVYRSNSGQTGIAKYTGEIAESLVSGKYFKAGATYYWVAE